MINFFYDALAIAAWFAGMWLYHFYLTKRKKK